MAAARERLLEATFACVARYGLAKTTMEDVAREAGMGRASVYRHFPGGRDELIREVIGWEVGRFFGRLADAVAPARDLHTLVEEALVFAHRALTEHAVLQKVLVTEPDLLLPQLTVEAERVLVLIRAYLVPFLAAEPLTPGVAPEAAADWIGRMFLSLLSAPGGWDLTDRDDVRRLVAELLAGVTAGGL